MCVPCLRYFPVQTAHTIQTTYNMRDAYNTYYACVAMREPSPQPKSPRPEFVGDGQWSLHWDTRVHNCAGGAVWYSSKNLSGVARLPISCFCVWLNENGNCGYICTHWSIFEVVDSARGLKFIHDFWKRTHVRVSRLTRLIMTPPTYYDLTMLGDPPSLLRGVAYFRLGSTCTGIDLESVQDQVALFVVVVVFYF